MAGIEERLQYGTALHAEVLNRINARLNLSYDKISQRFSDWDRVDRQVRMYLDLTEGAIRGDRTTLYGPDGTPVREMPFERSIVIPVSYAVLNVRLAQYMSILQGRKPLWSLEGRGPEDVRPSRLMEAVLDYDMEQCRALLAIYSALQDAEKYGIGVIYDVWTEEYGWKTNPRLNNPLARQLARIAGLPSNLWRVWGVTKEYNSWTSIDPYLFRPDPRVPKTAVQEGEFVGHRTFVSYLYLLERSVENGGIYFNVGVLPRFRGETTQEYIPKRDTILTAGPDYRATVDPDDKGYFAVDHIQIRLIPKEWKLGDGTTPEVWWFSVVNKAVIVRAHRSSYEHGQFTYAVGESNFDPHSLDNMGNIESLAGLQRFINWMLNSHFENIRKTLNDVLIYGASFVEETDIVNPGPARHIRLTQRGEELVELGMPITHFVSQLPVVDITAPHLQASQFLWEMVQRMMATSDPQMGHPTQKKKTLGEIQQVISGASMRLSVAFRLYEEMLFLPLVRRAIANRQQFTTLEQYYRITGEAIKEFAGATRELITVSDLQGNFDYSPRSEVLPPDPAKAAMAWTQFMLAISKAPQVFLAPGPDGKRLDPRTIINEMARALGIKNVSQLYVQDNMPVPPVRVVPDEEVEKQVQRGNMVPVVQQ